MVASTGKLNALLRSPRAWLLVVWLLVIFSASADSGSMHRSSRVLEPLLRLLMPHATAHTIATSVFIGRKFAHVTEYAILAVLCYGVFRKRPATPALSASEAEPNPEVSKPVRSSGDRGSQISTETRLRGLLRRELAAPLTRSLAFKILVFVFLYALTDEYHQSFVPTRYGSVVDVLIDLSGGVLGLLVIVVWQKSHPANKRQPAA